MTEVKTKGQAEEEEMSLAKAQEGMMKDQVNTKRMTGLVSVGFPFQLMLNPRGMEGAAGRGQWFEGRG